MVKCQGQNIKYLQKDLKRDIQVKYQGSSTHYTKVISKIKVFEKIGQSQKVNNNGSHGEVLLLGILMWNIKAKVLNVQK